MVTIPTIDQISGTTVMNKMRSLINNYIEFGGEIANTVNYMEEVIRNLPQDVTDVYNKETVDGMFSTAYTYIDTNFYKKTEVYTKAEVNNLVETVGSFRVVIVDELPEMGQEGIIYLIQRTSSTENDYDEYIWVSQWELIGQISNIDLANYYTKTESDAKYTQGVGNIGSDTKPVKIVDGQAVEVTDALQKSITIISGSESNVSVPNSTSTIIAEPSVTSGKYILITRFSSSGYSSGGGFFVNIKGVNYATIAFVSGLTPIANVTCMIEMAGDGTIPLRITQYSSSTMAFSVEYSLIKIN